MLHNLIVAFLAESGLDPKNFVVETLLEQLAVGGANKFLVAEHSHSKQK